MGVFPISLVWSNANKNITQNKLEKAFAVSLWKNKNVKHLP